MGPQYESEKFGKCPGQKKLKGMQMVQLDAPITQTPLSHSVLELENLPFLITIPLGQRELPYAK